MDFDWNDKSGDQIESSVNQPTPPAQDDEWEYVDEFIEEDDQSDSTVNEVTKRIEQAKLYESLLNHDFFGPGSARPEIQTKVTKEIRDFILERLTILVGMKEPQPRIEAQANMPWDDMQIEALTSIADRLVEKKSSHQGIKRPTVQAFTGGSTYEPKVQQAPQSSPPPIKKEQPKTRKVKRRKPKAEAQAPKTLPAGITIDPNSGNPMSENGIVLYGGQVKNNKKPPQSMPTQASMDQLNSAQVQRSTSGGSVGDKLLGLAISQAQSINNNIAED